MDEYAVDVLASDYVLASLQNPLVFVVSIAAVLFGYRTIVGELESGSAKLTAATSISRRDVFLAKLFARWVALLVPITGSIVAVWILGGFYHGHASPITVSLFTGMTALYALVNLAVGVSLSAAFATGTRAVTGSVAYLVCIIFLWAAELGRVLLATAVGIAPEGTSVPASELTFLVRRLSPRESYIVLTNWVLGLANTDTLAYHYVGQLPDNVDMSDTYVVEETFSGSHSLFLSEWFTLVILGGWIGVAVAIGTWRFVNRDVGR